MNVKTQKNKNKQNLPGRRRQRKVVVQPRRVRRVPQAPRPRQSIVPNSIGSQLGSVIGHGAQMLVKYITGFGDYSINNNSIMNRGVQPPELINSKNAFIVRHREYIADVLATTGFVNTVYPINPGMASTFPWLAGIAGNFEEYRLRGLVFEFKSMSSDAVLSTAANSALGTVIMATQYNSLLNSFTDKKTMENYEYANSSKPSESFIHPVECKAAINPLAELYIRTNNSTSGDIRFYDIGEFQIATQGMQVAGGVIGELWATFEVELLKPRLNSQVALTDHFQLISPTAINPLGTSQVLIPTSTLGTTVSGGFRITFPATVAAGLFLINYYISGTAAVLVAPPLTLSNCVLKSYFLNDSYSTPSNGGSTSANFLALWVLQVIGPSATIIFGINTIPTAATGGDLIITSINSTLAG